MLLRLPTIFEGGHVCYAPGSTQTIHMHALRAPDRFSDRLSKKAGRQIKNTLVGRDSTWAKKVVARRVGRAREERARTPSATVAEGHEVALSETP